MEPTPSRHSRAAGNTAGASTLKARLMNHILVVDDEAEIRSSLEEILREEGYGVASAATAAEAMVLLRGRAL
jgi:CheY-like chemotaxis protein